MGIDQAPASFFYKRMLLGQIGIIRRRRADGSFYPALLDDFRHYRDAWRRWNRRRHALRRAAAAPPR